MLSLNIPYLIGLNSRPENPPGFPNKLRFGLSICPDTFRYEQILDTEVELFNKKAYEMGSLLGTAMDDSVLGVKYADDFFQFIINNLDINRKNVLEIGCGRGALLSRINQFASRAIGIEPGPQNCEFWEKYGVNVIQGSFPNPEIQDKFEIVIGFLLLEHIANLDDFFSAIGDITTQQSDLIFAVPDCSDFIDSGDVGMLIHQHYHYFTSQTLSNTITRYGYKVKLIRKSAVGGILYAIFEKIHKKKRSTYIQKDFKNISDDLLVFSDKHLFLSSSLKNYLSLNKSNTGIYCPARIINILPKNIEGLRFFDDDPEYHGKYFPGVDCQIENFENFLADPPERILIASRSFFGPISKKIIQHSFPQDQILCMRDLTS